MLYLIDSFNVIFSGRELQKLALRDSSSAHSQFIEMISNFCEREDCRAILVFDGGDCVGVRCFYRDDLVKAYYAGGAADPLIIKLAPKIFKNHPELVVVSSDGVIRGHCGQMGIRTLGSMKFLRNYLAEGQTATSED